MVHSTTLRDQGCPQPMGNEISAMGWGEMEPRKPAVVAAAL